MSFDEELKAEEHFLIGAYKMFKKKKFVGTTGQAIKNSTYQFTQNVIFKIGSLIFTILLARILLPDLMGLYNLALSTIVLFSAFADLGVSDALLTFTSKMLGLKKQGKAKSYAKKLFVWKIYLSLFSSTLLLILAYFISNFYYQKPIFYALLVGACYIPALTFLGFFEGLFRAKEDFKTPLKKEILFQILRLVIVPLGVFYFIRLGFDDSTLIFSTLILITLVYVFSLLYLVIRAKKSIDFINVKREDLNVLEVKNLKRFIYPLSAMAFAGVFFGYIDTFMLGRFVSSSYIAYYAASFSLIASGATIISFASAALMPIFARKSGASLENIFKKTLNFVFVISILGALFAYFISEFIIKFAYGLEYLPAIPILKCFSILILFLPVLSLYNTYFITQERTKEIAILLFGSTILNIVLNVFGILYGLENYGEIGAVFGALIATIISRVFYLIGFILFKKFRKNI